LLSNREGTEQEAILRLRSVEDEILILQRPELFEETNVLNYLGQAYRTLGKLDLAEAYQTRSLQLFQQVENQQRALVSRYYLALIQFDCGRVEEAQQNYRDVLAEAQRIGYERAYCYCAYHLARALIGLNKFEEAEHWLNVTSELANQWDEPLLQAYVLFGRASLLRKQEQLVEAHNLAMAAVDAYQRLGSRDQREAAELIAQLEEEMA
jgi:tetratricopeptide (TPR) repeat protein